MWSPTQIALNTLHLSNKFVTQTGSGIKFYFHYQIVHVHACCVLPTGLIVLLIRIATLTCMLSGPYVCINYPKRGSGEGYAPQSMVNPML